MSLDTDWQVTQTAASGLAPQGPMDPIQCFRVRRIDSKVIVDLTGLRLDETRIGIANLGHLPDWAAAAIPQQYHWVNDDPTSLHASLCAIHLGRVLYWTGTVHDGAITKGQKAKEKITVARPAGLHGGFEFTTIAPWPDHIAPRPKGGPRWMP